MLIKSNKKRKVFSSLREVKNFHLDLKSEYVAQIGKSDEEIESGELNTLHHLIVKVPINKEAAIKNNVMYLEGFVCKNFKSLRTRAEMLSGFEKNNAQSLNYAIFNKEILAREDFQRKLKLSNLTKLFSLDMSLKHFSDVKIKDLEDNKKSDIDIFGYKEILDINDVRSSSFNEGKNFNRLDLSGISLSSDNKLTPAIGPFLKFQNERIKKISKRSATKNKFRKAFNFHLKSGVDPAKLIANSNYTSQSLNTMIKGRHPKNFKIQNQEEDFAAMFHEIVETLIPIESRNYTIKRKKVSKKHDTIAVNVFIGENIVTNLDSDIFDIVIFAKDKNKRIVDYYVISTDIKKLSKKHNLREKCLVVLENDKNKMICKRSGNNKSIVKLMNKSNFSVVFNILMTEYKQNEFKNNYMFEEVNNLSVESNQSIFAFSNKSSPVLSRYSSYFYRSSIGFNDIIFDNAIVDDIKFSRRIHAESSKDVNLKCENDSFRSSGNSSDDINNVQITISEIPNDVIGLNVVKRNLTKKEKEFKLIKNYNQNEKLANQDKTSLYELKDQQTIFLKRKEKNGILSKKYKFIDHDVEVGDVYEYKALLYDDNCVTSLSSNSSIYEYEERKNLIDITTLNVKSGSIPEKINKETSFTMNMELMINTKKDVFDDLFDSLDRNSYEAFSGEFDDIKESLKKNISCLINLINKRTGEKTHIDTFNNIVDGKLSFNFDIEESYSSYYIEVIPRIASLSQVIENALNKLANLPILQKNFPINTLHRNLTVKRNKILKQMEESNFSVKISEKPVDKYTGKSIKLFGLILDEVTRFNREKDDFYFEGTTGDNYYFDVYDPKQLTVSDNLTYSGFQDLSYLNDHFSQESTYKKIGILSLKSTGKSNIVNFYALYSKSNGTLTFLGLISPDDFGKNNYNFAIDLEEEIGFAEIYCVPVLKNGNYDNPKLITTLQCNNKNIEVL